MTITRNFKLCLNAGTQNAPYINVNQYDEGEQWIFDLYTEGGQKFTPSTGAIIGIKSDGNAILNSGTVNSDGQVVITETQQMTAASGLAVFELLIEGETHGTANFIVNVERRPSDDAEFSDSDLSLIQEAIDSAAEIEDLLGGQDVPTVITPIISDWLDENITNPSNPPIDTSLTVAGAAADAKATGDEITDLKSTITEHTAQIYSIGTELVGEIQTANVRYYDLWQAPKQGSVLTFKNVGTINGILVATKQDGTFQNLITFTSTVKEGTYTFNEQFKSIGFYGYQTGVAKIAVTGANFDMINENIINNVGEETLPKFNELSGDIYDISVIKSVNIEEASTRLYNLWLPPAPGTYVVENLGTNSFIFGGIKSNGSTVDLATFNAQHPSTQTVTITETLKSIGVYVYAIGNVNFKISGKAFSHIDKLVGKKVMFFGDSITADENRYRKWLLQNTGMELVESFAVSGATLTNFDDTVMDGNPTYGNDSNTVPNQVQKLINGTYSTVPDIVIVSAGTNDYYGKFNGGLNEAQFAVPDETISSLAVYIDVDTCDLTTPSGAMRWIYEKIISVYPNTQVYFATPIQRATYPSLFTYLKTKHDTMCAIADRLSCCVIDATYKSGIYSRYESNGASGKYLADGLHPNTDGGKLLAKCYEDEIRNQIHLVEN